MTLCDSVCITTNYTYADMNENKIMAYVSNLFTFFKPACV